MAGRSRAASSSDFTRRRLIVGVVLVCVVGAGVMFGLSQLRSSPSAGRFVYAARQGVFSRELSTGSDERLAELPDDVEAAMPSPDGRWVAYATGQGELWLQELGGPKRFQVAQRFTVPLGWSPDGRLIAGELVSDRDLVAVDPEGGREILLSGGYADGTLPVWLDDERFAIASDEEEFVIVDGTNPSDRYDGAPLAASPDGAELCFVTEEGVFVASVDGAKLGEPRRISKSDDAFAAATGPAGYLAVATPKGVDVFEGGTRSTRVLDQQVDWLGWGSRGRVLLYAAGNSAYALELPDGKPKRVTRDGADVFGLQAFAVVS